MQSISYLPASNGAANVSLMTVQNVRAANATSIITNTVSGAPQTFYATMGTPHTFTDPVTSEVITVISEATAVDFAGHLLSGHVEIDAIAPGYTDLGSKVGDIVIIRPVTEWANNLTNILGQSFNDNGSIKAAAYTYSPNIGDYIQTGGVWSALSGLNAAMTASTVWQGGYVGTVSAVATRAYTASKDTYVDVLRTLSGFTNTFTLVYTEVTNGAASPALAANSVRLAKVVSGASTITSIQQYGFDSLNNFIYPESGSSIQPIIFGGTSGTIAFTVPFDCVVEVVHSRAAWGFGGAAFGVFIALSSGTLNKVVETRSYVTGSDTVGRQMVETAIFNGATKNSSYTLTLTPWVGSGGGSVASSEYWQVKCSPIR